MFGRLGTSRKGLNAALGGQAGLSRKGGSQHGGGAGAGRCDFSDQWKILLVSLLGLLAPEEGDVTGI